MTRAHYAQALEELEAQARALVHAEQAITRALEAQPQQRDRLDQLTPADIRATVAARGAYYRAADILRQALEADEAEAEAGPVALICADCKHFPCSLDTESDTQPCNEFEHKAALTPWYALQRLADEIQSTLEFDGRGRYTARHDGTAGEVSVAHLEFDGRPYCITISRQHDDPSATTPANPSTEEAPE